MSDFSQSLIDGIIAVNTIYYQAKFHQATIKNANCESANFCGCDLLGAKFINVNLLGANFKNAVNIPQNIVEHLDQNFIYNENINKNFERHIEVKKRQVFISCPAKMTIEQIRYFKLFADTLNELGIEIKTYERSEYGNYGQIGKIRGTISQCNAVIIFGFKQLKINSGEYRPFTDEFINIKDTWMPTPWNNIEVGMALMKGLPVLIIKDPEVNDGIFDETISESFIHTISTAIDFKSKQFEEKINSWLNSISN